MKRTTKLPNNTKKPIQHSHFPNAFPHPSPLNLCPNHRINKSEFPSGKLQLLVAVKNALSIPKLKWKYTFQNHHKFQSSEKFRSENVLHMFTANENEDGKAR
jgi:hypothetical protein